MSLGYDLTNQKFGKLTAIKKIWRKGSNNIWECKCDCGNIKNVTTSDLKSKNTNSCGCYAVEAAFNRRENFVGKTYGHILVLDNAGIKNKKRYVLGKCVCGVIKEFHTHHLKKGVTISCGCIGFKNRIAATIKHKLSYNPLYFVWYSMMIRCYDPKFQDYKNYGGRNIEVCAEWFDVAKFIDDMTLGYKKGLQLDRIDNDGWYCKSNCQWSTRIENNRNKRTNKILTINNISLTAIEWAEKTGVVYTTILGRYSRGLRGTDLISTIGTRKNNIYVV
jgi:hypothetical protein